MSLDFTHSIQYARRLDGGWRWLRVAEDTTITNKPIATQRLPAQHRLELHRAIRAPDAPMGEILPQYGVHLGDLRKIHQTSEGAALAPLKVRSRHGRQATDVSSAWMVEFVIPLKVAAAHGPLGARIGQPIHVGTVS